MILHAYQMKLVLRKIIFYEIYLLLTKNLLPNFFSNYQKINVHEYVMHHEIKYGTNWLHNIGLRFIPIKFLLFQEKLKNFWHAETYYFNNVIFQKIYTHINHEIED